MSVNDRRAPEDQADGTSLCVACGLRYYADDDVCPRCGHAEGWAADIVCHDCGTWYAEGDSHEPGRCPACGARQADGPDPTAPPDQPRRRPSWPPLDELQSYAYSPAVTRRTTIEGRPHVMVPVDLLERTMDALEKQSSDWHDMLRLVGPLADAADPDKLPDDVAAALTTARMMSTLEG